VSHSAHRFFFESTKYYVDRILIIIDIRVGGFDDVSIHAHDFFCFSLNSFGLTATIIWQLYYTYVGTLYLHLYIGTFIHYNLLVQLTSLPQCITTTVVLLWTQCTVLCSHSSYDNIYYVLHDQSWSQPFSVHATSLCTLLLKTKLCFIFHHCYNTAVLYTYSFETKNFFNTICKVKINSKYFCCLCSEIRVNITVSFTPHVHEQKK